MAPYQIVVRFEGGNVFETLLAVGPPILKQTQLAVAKATPATKVHPDIKVVSEKLLGKTPRKCAGIGVEAASAGMGRKKFKTLSADLASAVDVGSRLHFASTVAHLMRRMPNEIEPILASHYVLFDETALLMSHRLPLTQQPSTPQTGTRQGTCPAVWNAN